MNVKFIDELYQLIQNYNLKTDDICICGSAVFTYEGIRENNDLDIVIRPEARKKIIEEYRDQIEILPSGTINTNNINIQFPYNRYKKVGIEDEEIFCGDYMIWHGDFFSVKPELELAQKIKRGWEKDKLDLKFFGYYIFEHPNFDMKLFQRLLKAQDDSGISGTSAIKKEEKSHEFYIEGEYIMPVGALLHRAYSEHGFNRYDILLISYFLSGRQQISVSEELISKLVDKRKLLLAEKRLKEEKMKNGFKVVEIDKNGAPEYGSIELCEAICRRDNYVKIQVNSSIEKKDYSLGWLNRNYTDLALEIEKYKEKIFEEYGVYFCAVVWGAAISYSEKIEDRIKEEVNIVEKKHIEFNEEDYCSFIREIYEIDDIDEWKIALKIEWLKKYEHAVDVIIFEIPFPRFREKIRDGSYLSDVGARLKREIREEYQKYIPDYEKDVIIHISDNHKHNAGMMEIIRKYEI